MFHMTHYATPYMIHMSHDSLYDTLNKSCVTWLIVWHLKWLSHDSLYGTWNDSCVTCLIVQHLKWFMFKVTRFTGYLWTKHHMTAKRRVFGQRAPWLEWVRFWKFLLLVHVLIVRYHLRYACVWERESERKRERERERERTALLQMESDILGSLFSTL